jgi:hypothetical protein
MAKKIITGDKKDKSPVTDEKLVELIKRRDDFGDDKSLADYLASK